MKKITPNLWFDKNAEDAVKYYTSLFENSNIGKKTYFSKEGFEFHGMAEGSIASIEFHLIDQQFLALNGGPSFKFNEAISLFLYCESDEKIEFFYEQLSAGGSILMPLNKYEWSPRYAWVKDKFGVSWQLDVDKMKSPQKILPALLFVNDKFDRIKEAITFYSSIFDNSKILMEVPNNNDEITSKGVVQFAQFRLSDYLFNAMSSNLKHEFDFNEAISFIINCENQVEIDYYWEKLTEGGDPKAQMCGWLKDKYDVSWQVVPTALIKMLRSSDKEKIARAEKAMLKMKKLDLSVLQKSFNGLG